MFVVNGGWTAFTQVGTCSQTCGEGGVIRTTRMCTNPPPSCGGRDCMGDMEVMINCSQPQCPMPGIMSLVYLVYRYTVTFLFCL